MFIVFEGADGTGKSTISQEVANKFGFIYYSTPPKQYAKKRGDVDRNYGVADHYKFYLQALKEASREIAALLRLGGVVADRYWMTTFAYHKAMGHNCSPDDFSEIIRPDVTIYLEVDPLKQKERIEVRGATAGDERTALIQQKIRNCYEDALRGCANLIRIDTTEKSIEEVVREVTIGIGK